MRRHKLIFNLTNRSVYTPYKCEQTIANARRARQIAKGMLKVNA